MMGIRQTADIRDATYYNWRKKFGGLMPSKMKPLQQLEDTNQRVKNMVANLSLDKDMRQYVIRQKKLRPALTGLMVDLVRQIWRVSIRRACRDLPVDPSTHQ